MSEISINPAALHIVANVLGNSDQKAMETVTPRSDNSAPVISKVRARVGSDDEKITSSAEAHAATLASRKLIQADTNAALMAQAHNLPSEVLDLLGD